MSFGRGIDRFGPLCDHKWETDEWHPDWQRCKKCLDTKKVNEIVIFGL